MALAILMAYHSVTATVPVTRTELRKVTTKVPVTLMVRRKETTMVPVMQTVCQRVIATVLGIPMVRRKEARKALET